MLINLRETRRQASSYDDECRWYYFVCVIYGCGPTSPCSNCEELCRKAGKHSASLRCAAH